MGVLAGWTTNPHDRRPLDVLEHDPRTPAGWAAELEQLLNAPERTLQSVFLTLSLTFSFMGNPAAAAAVTPGPGDPSFDVLDFLARGGTLYLLGADTSIGSLAPLVSCLTTEVYEGAIALATRQPAGRLDPPLMLVLDEVAQICPVPLDRWTSVAGGWGIPLVYAVQSPSQLYERWGKLPGQTIWNNTTVLIAMGGLGNAEYLRELSELTGERQQETVTVSRDRGRTTRSTSTRPVPVMSPAEIRMLKDWQALVLHRNTPPIKAKLTPIWKRTPR